MGYRFRYNISGKRSLDGCLDHWSLVRETQDKTSLDNKHCERNDYGNCEIL